MSSFESNVAIILLQPNKFTLTTLSTEDFTWMKQYPKLNLKDGIF